MFYRSILNKFEMADEYYSRSSLTYFYGLYFRARATEFLHSSISRLMILNHWETWFAPLVAQMFPSSKFVYLKRNKVDNIFSLLSSAISNRKLSYGEFSKNYFDAPISEDDQVISANSNNWCMDVYKEEKTGNLTFDKIKTTPLVQMNWQYETVEKLANSLHTSVGSSRFLNISSDRLFQSDIQEIRRFMSFLEISTEEESNISSHFSRKFNAKKKFLQDEDIVVAKKEIGDRLGVVD